MSTSSYMPAIARKKRVSSKYNPNTYRVVAYTENDEPPKYPEVPNDVRKMDPLGLQVNMRPDMLDHSTHVLPYNLPDYRANRPQPRNCGFLRLNAHTLNEPVCRVDTVGQPKGHWIAPQLLPETNPSNSYKLDTVFRQDFCGTKNDVPDSNAGYHVGNAIQHTSLKSFHLNNLEDDAKVREKISYEHCYNSRTDSNYPLRGKRHGSFVWNKLPQHTTNHRSNLESHSSTDERSEWSDLPKEAVSPKP